MTFIRVDFECDGDDDTNLLCHIGTPGPVLYRQLLPPHFPSYSPHRKGSKTDCTEIQCNILPIPEFRIWFSCSFVLCNNHVQVQIVHLKSYPILTIQRTYRGLSRKTEPKVATS